MAYSNESINKFAAKVRELTNHYLMMNASDIKISISGGNRKIGRVMNISTPAIITCGHACKVCRGICYDIKACLQYASCIDARARNLAILILDRDEFFRRIDKAMDRRRKNKCFRWHVAGDILDIDYFDRMVENARKHSDFKIWTYTKRYEIVNKWCAEHGRDAIPANLSIMYSLWKGLPCENPYHFGTFRCVMHDEKEPDNGWKCPGNYDICKACNRGCLVNEDTWTNEH